MFALIGCALAIDLARAQSPTAETGTTLHPGVNLVGWVAEPTPVSQLFREIPQLESIWAWDAELRDWIVASRGAPEWLGGLRFVWTGMGLRLVLGGEEPFVWQRSTEPIRGLVKLHTGWNLVAWSGADQTPIDDALKGIGWSLRAVHRWNPTTQQWTTWTSPERTAQLIAAASADQEAGDESEMPAIRRGEALWINVACAVNWLQPTDIFPRLVFPGGASDELQAVAREKLETTLAFFRDEYGIQAEPSLAIYVASDVDALIQALEYNGAKVNDAEMRTQWRSVGSGGWANAWRNQIVLKSRGIPLSINVTLTKDTLTHEYFHILQASGSIGYVAGHRPPNWLIEGTATWAPIEQHAVDGRLPIHVTPASYFGSPPLHDDTTAVYSLGAAAAGYLVELVGAGSHVEFFRRMESAKRDSGPLPGWRAVFLDVFGLSVEDFYADFEEWRGNQPQPRITGRFWTSDDRLIAGKTIWAGVYANYIEHDGSFAIPVNPDGRYSIRLSLGGCQVFVDGGGVTANWEERVPVRVDAHDVDLGLLEIPSDVCAHRISSRIIDSGGAPLSEKRLDARGPHIYNTSSVRTDADGRFEIRVPSNGAYTFGVQLRSQPYCWRNLAGRALGSPNNPVYVSSADATDIVLRLPRTIEELCR